jgi:hypothetical protein
VNKPVIDPRDNPQLLYKKTNIFKKLTKEELDNIVEQTNLWYKKKKVVMEPEAVG